MKSVLQGIPLRLLRRLRFYATYPAYMGLRLYCLIRGRRVVHFIHNFNTANAGDVNACPLNYFGAEFSKVCFPLRHDLYFLRKKIIFKNDPVIVGGGGLLNCVPSWNASLNALLAENRRVIFWGVGFNTHDGRPVFPPVALEKAALVGVRDYGHPSGAAWVPCPSCFLPDLERTRLAERSIGVISHIDYKNPDFAEFEQIDNYQPVGEVLEFIAASAVVATSSYHAMYWATLMGKKVILFSAFSEKFRRFKYPPSVYAGDLQSALAAAKSYPDALAECREANLFFLRKVLAFLESENAKEARAPALTPAP